MDRHTLELIRSEVTAILDILASRHGIYVQEDIDLLSTNFVITQSRSKTIGVELCFNPRTFFYVQVIPGQYSTGNLLDYIHELEWFWSTLVILNSFVTHIALYRKN